MKSITSIVLLFCIAATVAVDIAAVGPSSFGALDSIVTSQSLAIQAGAALTSVTFTATPSSPSIAIYYPSSGTNSNVGSIANGAVGFGGFQILGSHGLYTITFNITYKKSNVWYNHITANYNLAIGEGGESDGKRDVTTVALETIKLEDGIEVTLRDSEFNMASFAFVADDSIPTWQSLAVQAGSSAVSQISYTVVPSSPSIGISFGPNGNAISNLSANGVAGSSFQVNCAGGVYTYNFTYTYKIGGVQKKQNFIRDLYCGEGGGSDGKRSITAEKAEVAKPSALDITVVASLAIGGVALVAVVAIVIAVVIVKKQSTPNYA